MSRRHRSILVSFVALSLVVTACGGTKKKGSTPPPKGGETTTTTAPPIAPLSGTPDPGGAANARCAVTVKIDNTKSGHPKYGVEDADVVFEEVVEGGITRLAAVFNSQAPKKVGPVRSVRKTDQTLVWPLKGIFAYSGGAPYAITSINTAPVVRLDETHAGKLMSRDRSRRAPWNLYLDVGGAYARCTDPAPPALFTYRPAGSALTGDSVVSAKVGFLAGFDVTWQWDATSGTWKRSIFGQPETTAANTQFAPKNVVIMFVSYTGGDPRHGNEGAEADIVGKGQAWVLSDGKIVKGTWTRPDKAQPAQILDATGNAIGLTPGQTWVELPDVDYTVTVTAPTTPGSSTP